MMKSENSVKISLLMTPLLENTLNTEKFWKQVKERGKKKRPMAQLEKDRPYDEYDWISIFTDGLWRSSQLQIRKNIWYTTKRYIF